MTAETQIRSSVEFKSQILDYHKRKNEYGKFRQLTRNERGILGEVDGVLSQVEDEQGDWISRKVGLLGEYLRSGKKYRVKEKVPGLETKVRDNFQRGLRAAISHEYVSMKASNPDFVMDREYLLGLTKTYGFDFFRVLTVAKRIGINPESAIEFARVSYVLNPSAVVSVNSEYKDLGWSARRRALFAYHRDPNKYLDIVREAMGRLKEDPKYSSLSKDLINRAASDHYKDPEGWLDKVMSAQNRLTNDPRYINLTPGTIRMATKSRKNPEKFLDDSLILLKRLLSNRKYEGLTKGIVYSAVFIHSGDAQGFLNNVLDSLKRVSGNSKYGKLSKTALMRAVVRQDPEDFLDRYLEAKNTVKKDNRYVEISPYIIEGAILNNPNNYTKTLDKYNRAVTRIRINPKYSDLDSAVINRITFQYPRNPEKQLDAFIRERDRLYNDKRFVGVNRSILFRAALHYPSDPDSFVIRYKTALKRLRENSLYKDLDEDTLDNAAIRLDPEGYIDDLLGSHRLEILDMWKQFATQNMRDLAIERGYISEDEVEDLFLYFDGDEKIPSEKLLDKLSLAVANLAS